MNTYIEKIKELALQNKYTKYYCNIIEAALLRPQDRKHLKAIYGYVESHHILPRCFGLGGEKDKENLVFLTAKEHFIIHLCATKMFESIFKNKMIFAFRQLKSNNKHQDRHINSRMYAIIKPDFKSFIRLYKGEQVKYLYKNQVEEISLLEKDGWSREMTEEFKEGRVGQMKGRKHSEESKKKMSEATKGKPKEHLRGIKRTEEEIAKMIETKRLKKENNPEEYWASFKKGAETRKKMYESGELDMSGENNPMYGKHHTEEAKKKISDNFKNWMEKAKSDPVLWTLETEKRREAQLNSWKNSNRRENSKIFNSKSMQKLGIHPQEYYNQKLKPLLYLGFLPTAIIKFKLLDVCKGSIKRLIYTWGTSEDIAQFEENKRRGAGASKAYIQFQKDQYKKYFENKTDEECNVLLLSILEKIQNNVFVDDWKPKEK